MEITIQMSTEKILATTEVNQTSALEVVMIKVIRKYLIPKVLCSNRKSLSMIWKMRMMKVRKSMIPGFPEKT